MKILCTLTCTNIYKSPEPEPRCPASPSPESLILVPLSTPGGTFTDNQQPFRTPNSKDQGNKYGDVSELLFANADMIAEYAVNKMLAANPSYTIPTGNTACYDDVRDFIQKCVAHNLKSVSYKHLTLPTTLSV